MTDAHFGIRPSGPFCGGSNVDGSAGLLPRVRSVGTGYWALNGSCRGGRFSSPVRSTISTSRPSIFEMCVVGFLGRGGGATAANLPSSSTWLDDDFN